MEDGTYPVRDFYTPMRLKVEWGIKSRAGDVESHNRGMAI